MSGLCVRKTNSTKRVCLLAFCSLTSLFVVLATILTTLPTATAFSATSISINKGPITGGTEVTIYGDFGIKKIEFEQISNGGLYTCALNSAGQAYCWGENWNGSLGDNSTTNRTTPVAVDTTGVLAGKTLTQISSGNGHTCALDSAGQVYCWGYNTFGQIGDGTTIDRYVPLAVDFTGTSLSGVVTQIITGYNHTCVIDSIGQAYCWGYNDAGQLGTDSYGYDFVPMPVDNTGVLAGKTITQMSASGSHTCALDSAGQVYCWGNNWYGQLGHGPGYGSHVPMAVDMTGVLAGKTITQISANSSNTCALDSLGRVYCWGDNSYGQLGDNSTTGSDVPVAVDITGALAGKTIVQIASGGDYTCALDSAGQVYCWGSNDFGQLGNNSTTDNTTPVVVGVPGLLAGKTLTQISAHFLHACAVDSDNNAYCWGGNDSGQLGNNTITDSATPVAVYNYVPHPSAFTVMFDTAPCVGIRFSSDNNIICTTTAHLAGLVDVVVSDGVNSSTLAEAFEYMDIAVPNTGFKRQ